MNPFMQKQKVLAIIPARKNSKGIPNKNVTELGSIPLLAHSICSARNCRHITRIIVSTDCPEIAAIAREWEAEVPFLRPKFLAGDTAPLDLVFNYTCERLKKVESYEPDALVILLPTHPFRSSELMDKLTLALVSECRVVKTVRRFSVSEISHFIRNESGVRSLQREVRPIEKCFRGYGLYYGSKIHGAFDYQYYIHVIESPAECIDIDDPGDLERAKQILRNGEFIPAWM